MTLAVGGARREAGVSRCRSQPHAHLGRDLSDQGWASGGQAYVIDERGRLIAHPDISLVLSNTDVSHLAQVRAARAAALDPAPEQEPVEGIQGGQVLCSLRIRSVAWLARFRRAACCRGLRADLCLDPALGDAACCGAGARSSREHAAGATHGGAHPGAPNGRGENRQRRSQPASSRSRPVMSSKRWAISSTAWRLAWRSSTRRLNARSKSARTSSNWPISPRPAFSLSQPMT